MTLFYLASPYSHPDVKVVRQRCVDIRLIAGELVKRGISVLSPIIHNGAILDEVVAPDTWEYWEKQDFSMFQACQATRFESSYQ